MSRTSWYRDAEGRPRTVWRIAFFLASVVLVAVIVSIALGIALSVLVLAASPGASDQERLIAWLETYAYLLQSPVFLVMILLVLLFRRYVDRRSIASLGLGRPAGRLVDWPVGFWLGALPILVTIALLAGLGVLRITGLGAGWMTLLLVPVFAVGAFGEEIMCRGYLLRNFIDSGCPKAGIVFSSVVFWIFHSLNPAVWSSPWNGLNLFTAGVLLALAYRVSGNLWFPTALHYAWNLFQGVVFEIPVSGIETDGLVDVRLDAGAPAWLTGGRFGLEGSALVWGMQCALIAGLLVALWAGRRR
jgi:uncharacterized protein